ncbi:4Fe-4S dicluster domain-containing protein [Corallincola luteus]|uniref:4Fe-4S dicluster domain-containing protein n=2 Tax=Corallincola TaxID=1775176 RepID=A0A368NS90_9GAMM|nr:MULTISPECIES: 4Fe-4S dicluster domain-containing protein [Corallincola]RCU52554.1 4Fe-4S dicluster domain-containing protein [Corallincola holothuriorum]TCI02452.1 4Fe-4S dicluster domain-containing protein [Corallincola luteus]
MAFEITASCIGCNACKLVCPQKAITVGPKQYSILPHRCNECVGHHADPQCASICPVETAIVNAEGRALNPPGSLTGLPDERKVVALSKRRARL